ncbi:hypothetical protein HYE68_000165 [Fusarium pseudograminearum]|nr:hypothetical protein HYE68_000165 [Fusarium pseudograminearum]
MAQPVIDEEDYPSWFYDDDFRVARFEGDPRSTRSVIRRLDTTLSLRHGHKPKKWGFAMIRTAYGPGSDQKFEHALDMINNIAQHWSKGEVEGLKSRIALGKETDFRYKHVPVEVDTRPNEEFVRRYENDVVEDQSLENASFAALREYFKTWIASKGGRSNVGNTRYVACIMLDAETLSQLATAPKGFPYGCDIYSSSYWVKMVDVEASPDEAIRVRVRGSDDLINYWFTRNIIRSHVLTHRKDREYPGVLYFGDPPSLGFEAMKWPPFP